MVCFRTIITRTPFRLSFFGGGSDYPAWYRKHGGSVLATTIDKYCYLNCRYYPPFFEHRFRAVYAKSENCRTIAEISHPAIRGVLQYLNWDRGVEIHHIADLPARAGIGSSSSFTVGLLQALYGLRGRIASKHDLASESIHIEQNVLRETVGSQDQVSTAYGGLNHITFLKDGDFEVTPVTVPKQRVEELQSHLMLFYTGIKRTASEVADSYLNEIETKGQQIEQLLQLVPKGLAVLQGNSDIEANRENCLMRDGGSRRALGLELPILTSMASTRRPVRRALSAVRLPVRAGGGFMMLFCSASSSGKSSRVVGCFCSCPL